MEKISKQEEQLLNTDFGEEIEKVAACRAQAITDAYDYGLSKHAAEVADNMEKIAAGEDSEEGEGEEEEEEGEMDEESEKAAAELGAFIERGFYDGLRKLGSERYDNELIYLMPYIQEKVAISLGMKARAALEKHVLRPFNRKTVPVVDKIKESPTMRSALDLRNAELGSQAGLRDLAKDVVGRRQGIMTKATSGVRARAQQGKQKVTQAVQDKVVHPAREGIAGRTLERSRLGQVPGTGNWTSPHEVAGRQLGAWERAKRLAPAAAIGTATAGGVGAAGYGGYKALSKD